MEKEAHNLPDDAVSESPPGKKEMPADGGGRAKGMPNGVSASPGAGETGEAGGRTGRGESAGGAYPNLHSGKVPTDDGFGTHGGQSDNAYYGGDNPNATTKPRGSDANVTGQAPAIRPEREPHIVRAEGQTFEVVEQSGVAAAEASGKVATDASYEREQETPGGG